MAAVLSGDECLQAVSQAIKMYNRGNAEEARQQLAVVKQKGKVLIKESETLFCRLEGLKPFVLRKQSDIAREMAQLQESEKNLQNEIDEIGVELSHQESELNCQSQRLQNVRRQERRAQREREEAEVKNAELDSKWWVPVYGQFLVIREWVQDNRTKEREAAIRVRTCADSQRAIQNKILDLKVKMDKVRQKKDSLSDLISDLKRKQDENHENLRQIRKATDMLMSTARLGKEIVAAVEHGDGRCDVLKKIVEKASLSGNRSILSRRGSQTQAKSFIDTWNSVRGMVTQAESHGITFDFQCSYCGKEDTGLPWPLSGENVMCDSCHTKVHGSHPHWVTIIFLIFVFFYYISQMVHVQT